MLTAAHCVVNSNTGNVKDPGSIQILVDAHDTTDSNMDRRDISTIRTHPEYNNDEALPSPSPPLLPLFACPDPSGPSTPARQRR